VEYIIYGLDSCLANQSAAYGEMFTLRLVIRSLEVLFDPKRGAGAALSPMLMILSALAEGAAAALQDMHQLVQGAEVPLSKITAKVATFNYLDYLRLFLFLHGGNDSVISRIQALIEFNTGLGLESVYVSAQGQAVTSIKPWFVPYLACQTGGNRCAIHKTIYDSY
jgi:hypothetical protein